MYVPNPIDTSDIALPEELSALAEQIAENVHEVWAAERIAQGWTYGDKRDDFRKTTPCLVPYSELPENEKRFDRLTEIATLKLLLKMGYKITRA